MKQLLLLAIVFIFVISCGKREDNYYFACNDGSGSQKCRTLDQQELSKYVQDDRRYRWYQTGVISNRPGSDENAIQTYLLREDLAANQSVYNNTTYYTNSGSYTYQGPSYFSVWDQYVVEKTNDSLNCAIEKYYGVLNEESSNKECYTLRIYGVEYQDAAYVCRYYNIASIGNGRTLELYKEEKTNCQ